jgi:hypothetical protein
MLFIISYHKTLSQSNASRWPARFLLPEAAQLVTQYLAIILPFRKFYQDKVPDTGAVSEFFWSRKFRPWTEDPMSRVVIDTGKRILAKKIHVQAWRQITVGIARKKFSSAVANLLTGEG